MPDSLLDMIKELDPPQRVVESLRMYVDLAERTKAGLDVAMEALERIANQNHRGKHKPPSAYSAKWALIEVRKALYGKDKS